MRWIVLILVALECNAAQPVLNIIEAPASGRVGQPIPLVLEVSWDNPEEAQHLAPPEIPEVDWGQAKVVRSTAETRQGRARVEWTIAFTANEAGTHETPEFEIPILLPEAATPTETGQTGTFPPDLSVYPALSVAPFLLRVSPDRTPIQFFGGLGSLLILGLILAAALMFWYKSKSRQQSAESISPMDRARATLQQAREARLAGDYYAIYRALTKTLEIFGEGADPQLVQTLEKRVQDTGYRGYKPTHDELDGDFRAVERHLRSQTNNPPAQRIAGDNA